MATPDKTQDTAPAAQDRFWHFLWSLAGLVAFLYGCFGIAAWFSQPDRHTIALAWFLVATVGGLSMVSFVWRSGDGES